MKNLYLFILIGFVANLSSQVNIDFEQSTPGQYFTSNGVTGWTIQAANNNGSNGQCAVGEGIWSSTINEFYIVATPALNIPVLGTVGHSPLGGAMVGQLQNQSPGIGITRISQNINVTANNCFFQYAFCGTLDGGGHTCCDQPFARFDVMSCGGGPMACLTNSITSAGASCPGTTTMMTGSNGQSFIPWTIKSVDLSPFIGTCITVRFTAGDCSAGSHYSAFYFDAKIGPQNLSSGLTNTTTGPLNPVNFCAGSGTASIQGPLGYNTYSWVAPNSYPPIPSSQATLSAISLTNPVANSVFSLNMSTVGNCLFVATYTISNSTVVIAGTGAGSTCINGTAGSATVQGAGSGTGYNYTWINSTNSVVGTSSVLSNVGVGVYSVQITAIGAPSCGTAVTTVTVGVSQTNSIFVSKPFCGNTAYLMAPPGTNYQWYVGTSSVSPSSGGQASSFTVTNATANSNFHLTYLSAQGCRDSVKYTLSPANPGPLVISSNTICVGGTNGTAAITLPQNSSTSAFNYFIVNNVSPTPVYNASVNNSSSNSFTVNNLVGGAQYTVTAFDGSCLYNASLIPATINFNYAFAPSSPTLCNNNSTQNNLQLTGNYPPGAFTYSWSPATFLSGAAIQSPIITPTIAAGTQSFITYSVVVTPTVLNCPLTKTYTVYYANPTTPSLGVLNPVCQNAASLNLTASPGPGQFVGNTAVSLTGELTPSLAAVGVNSVTYVHTLGGCAASTTGTFMVNPIPTVAISGNKTICQGDSLILTASGAANYNWSNSANGATVVVAPPASTTVMVVGTSFGCSASKIVQLNVVNMPALQVNNAAVCKNQSATLIANGADTYSWSTGSKASQIVVTPLSTTVYTLTGTNSGLCTRVQLVIVTVTPIPTLSIAGNYTVCKGDKVTFTVTGADTYSWSTAATTSVVSFIVTGNKFYTVDGYSNPGNCSSSVSFNVNAMPCTGISENEENSSITIFPNPNAGEFYIEAKEKGFVEIFDPLGRLVVSQSLVSGKNPVTVQKPAAGIYLIKFTTKDRTYVEKMWISN